MADVLVIGAGLSGLACAWQLKQLGMEARILERSDRAGGVVRSERIDGHLVEHGPNMFLPTAQTLRLLDELGLAKRSITADPRAPRYVCFGHRLRRAPFGPMSPLGLLRVVCEPLIRSKSAANESVRDFFIRRIGSQAHDRLVAPLLTGINAGDTGRLSMASVFPKQVEMERNYGSLFRGMMKSRGKGTERRGGTSSFPDGMEELPKRLAQDLTIEYGAADIRLTANRHVEWQRGSGQFKAIVVTAPAEGAAMILEKGLPEAAAVLSQIPYAPMTIVLSSIPESAFAKPLQGFGFLVPRSEKLHILGTLFTSCLFERRAPKGRVLLTTFIGGAIEPETIEWDDSRIGDTVQKELPLVLKTSSPPEVLKIIRYRHAIPQYNIGHEQKVAAVRQAIQAMPGLFLAGSYMDGVSVSNCLDNGSRAAQQVAEYLRSNS